MLYLKWLMHDLWKLTKILMCLTYRFIVTDFSSEEHKCAENIVLSPASATLLLLASLSSIDKNINLTFYTH